MLHVEIDNFIAEAMKSQDVIKLRTLRMIKSELVKKEKDGGTLTESVEANILMKMVSQREEAIAQFKSANRMDLVDNEMAELDIIKAFAPKQATDEEITEETKRVIDALRATQGTVSMKDMKMVLSEVQKTYPTANGKLISQIVKTFC